MTDLSHIIHSSIKGHQKSQRMLYDIHRTQWFMVSMRYGKNKMQAEDIFQEGLIQIFKDLHQYDEKKSKFKTWSSRVIAHAALKYLKKYTQYQEFEGIEKANDHLDQNENAFQKLARKELTMLIQQLPTGYRIVFNMYAIEGYSHKEISKQLNISEGTSKSQLFKARKELRLQLESQLKVSHHE